MSNGRAGPPLFTVLTFWAFVVGGLVFGVIFVGNWRVLAARMDAAPRAAGAPPPGVRLGAGPVSVTLPVSVSGAPKTTASAPAPSKQSQVASSIVSVVKTVLPDWQDTDRVNLLLLGI